MNWLEKIRLFNHKGTGSHSQFGESEIIKFIFNNIQPENKYFVDIGAGFYGHGIMSNTNDLLNDGWQGLQIDANNSDNPVIKQLYVTPENILPFLEEHEVPLGFDLLTIDIDSFDLDILEKVVPAYSPRVICTEFNPALEGSVKLKYEAGYIWNETTKYGYSFEAAVKFCNKYGYKIILNHIEQNLFLVRGDLIGEPPPATHKTTNYHKPDLTAEWEPYE